MWGRIVEQGRLLVQNAVTAEDYYNCALYRRELDWSAKRAFVGGFEKHRYFNALNLPVYDIVARDKAVFHHLAASLGLRIPETLATTGAHRAPTAGRVLNNVQDLCGFLAGESRLFFKPADGSLGEGALALGAALPGGGWQELPGGRPIGLDAVLAHVIGAGGPRRFLVQRLLEPHAEIASIVPGVLATVRIMTLSVSEPVVIGCGLRLGNGRMPVDNFSGGGVIVPVALDSGRLGMAVELVDEIPRRVANHPVTGAAIAGRVVPNWTEVVAMVLEGAQKLRFLPCIAWDIGLTDAGPVVVEVNTRPGCRAVQLAADRGLLAGPLGSALAPCSGFGDCGISVPRQTSRTPPAPGIAGVTGGGCDR